MLMPMGERSGGFLVALGTILAIALVAGGVAVLARSVSAGHPTNGPDRLVGTEGADTIDGLAGADRIRGLAGPDLLTGGPGFDVVYGGRGRDRIRARDHQLDQIDCGRGIDTAVVDRAEDGVFDCERVVTPRSFAKSGAAR
jgi:Ca2+-binding RTX toxin-like protein